MQFKIIFATLTLTLVSALQTRQPLTKRVNAKPPRFVKTISKTYNNTVAVGNQTDKYLTKKDKFIIGGVAGTAVTGGLVYRYVRAQPKQKAPRSPSDSSDSSDDAPNDSPQPPSDSSDDAPNDSPTTDDDATAIATADDKVEPHQSTQVEYSEQFNFGESEEEKIERERTHNLETNRVLQNTGLHSLLEREMFEDIPLPEETAEERLFYTSSTEGELEKQTSSEESKMDKMKMKTRIPQSVYAPLRYQGRKAAMVGSLYRRKTNN